MEEQWAHASKAAATLKECIGNGMRLVDFNEKEPKPTFFSKGQAWLAAVNSGPTARANKGQSVMFWLLRISILLSPLFSSQNYNGCSSFSRSSLWTQLKEGHLRCCPQQGLQCYWLHWRSKSSPPELQSAHAVCLSPVSLTYLPRSIHSILEVWMLEPLICLTGHIECAYVMFDRGLIFFLFLLQVKKFF